MNGKGDKWRGGWTSQYADNHNRIFNKNKGKKKMTTPKMYLEMWLSEQIPTNEWQRILKDRKDVNELYQKHLENKK